MRSFAILLFTLCSVITGLQAQPLAIGDSLPDFSLLTVNGSSPLKRSSLQGKVVVLDFWATFCAPCIQGMEDYQALQEAFPEEMVVVTLTEESPERIAKFLEKRPYTFPFGIDAQGEMRALFPYRIIPHAVLISPAGTVLAITQPKYITEEVIQNVLDGVEVHLPMKEDALGFDFTKDYFQRDTTTTEAFVIQPSILGLGSVSMRPKGVFEDRRLSMFNFPIDGLYRHAYQTTAYRMVYEVDESLFDYQEEANKYCLDIVVPAGQEEHLYTTMQEKLAESFSIQARLETREMEVARLFRLEDQEGTSLVESEQYHGTQEANGSHFISKGAPLADFADYLESYGIVGMAVVDDTQDSQPYVIDFEFLPEDPETFHAALEAMGLGLKRVTRPVEVLVIYQP